jgi:peroxiredoxin-like protein
MSIVKDFRFPVSVQLVEGRRTVASAVDKDDLEIATPPEFRDGVPGVWSPEELLVSAAASCYAVTLAAVLERRAIPVHALTVSGAGHVTRRDDGRFGFVAIELDLRLDTAGDRLADAVRAAERAKNLCIVTMALDVPVRVGTDIRAVALEPALS